MYLTLVFGVSGAVIGSVTIIVTSMQHSESTVQSPKAVSRYGQRRRLWVNSETALGGCHMFPQIRHDLVLSQHRRRLTGTQRAVDRDADADPTLNRTWVVRPTSSVRGTS